VPDLDDGPGGKHDSNEIKAVHFLEPSPRLMEFVATSMKYSMIKTVMALLLPVASQFITLPKISKPAN
jgi:hypothetical protein